MKALRSGNGNVKVNSKLEKIQREWEEEQNVANRRELPTMVKALKSEVVHYDASHLLCSQPFTWRTVCGWHYNSGAYTFLETPSTVTCQKCLASNSTTY